MISPRLSLKHQLFGAWCAPIFSLFTAVGWLGFAHFIYPARAGLTAAQMAQWFTVTHRDGVLIGCFLFLLSTCFLAIWTAQLGIMLWRMEGRSPLMSIVQMMSGLAIVVIVIINCSLWMSAAYRPGASPDVVQALNDAAWLGFLIAWPVLSMQMLATAPVAWHDRRRTPLFPRRLFALSILGAVLLICASGPAFAQHGAFDYDGALGFYLPGAIWGL